jgi:hypothetical protein
MIVRIRPFPSERARASRLPLLAFVGLAYLLLALWNPVQSPGPVLCVARLAFAVPCPLCGATRGVALSLRGEVAQATMYNPLSVPVAILGLLLLALWLFEYLSNREVSVHVKRPWQIAFVAFWTLAFVATWVYLIVWRREDNFATSWLGQMLHLL